MDLVNDGFTKVTFVPASPGIADIKAPTVSELTATGCIDLETRITPDGYKNDVSSASVDTSSLASTFDTTEEGRSSFDTALTLKRGDDAPDNDWETKLPFRAAGFMVVRRDVVRTAAYAAADKVEVFPVRVGRWQPVSPAANSVQKITVPLRVTADPVTLDDPAIVAAGA